MKIWLDSEQIHRNPKTVLRIMHKYDMQSEICRHKRWMSEQLHKYENIRNRDFHVDRPDWKYVTDISYIFTNAMGENFFVTLKTESIYRHKPKTYKETNKMIDDYIYFYNHERIQLKTGLAKRKRSQSC